VDRDEIIGPEFESELTDTLRKVAVARPAPELLYPHTAKPT
jgi:hypothetical protein